MIRSLLGVLCVLAIPAAATAIDGVQETPDGSYRLAVKDVGSERWTIMYSPSTGAVIGNVGLKDSPTPQFVWCSRTAEAATGIVLTCSGADACVASPCGATGWTNIGEVTLPLSFFEPSGDAPPSTVRRYSGTIVGEGSQRHSACYWLATFQGTATATIRTGTSSELEVQFVLTYPEGRSGDGGRCLPGSYVYEERVVFTPNPDGTFTAEDRGQRYRHTFTGTVRDGRIEGTYDYHNNVPQIDLEGSFTLTPTP